MSFAFGLICFMIFSFSLMALPLLFMYFSDRPRKITNKCINGVFEDNVRITKFSIFITIFNLIILIISIIK
jgi:hypothetical protein